jgi:hypothetical protein
MLRFCCARKARTATATKLIPALRCARKAQTAAASATEPSSAPRCPKEVRTAPATKLCAAPRNETANCDGDCDQDKLCAAQRLQDKCALRLRLN